MNKRTVQQSVILACALMSASLSAATTTETLTFDTDQLPPGWSFGKIGDNAWIGDGRVNAGAVDSGALLTRTNGFPTAMARITVEWTGPVAYSYWGQCRTVGVLLTNGFFLSAHAGHADNLWPGMLRLMIFSARPDYAFAYDEAQDTLFYDQQISLEFITLRYKAIFEPGKVSFAARRLADNSSYFEIAEAVPPLNLAAVSAMQLACYETTGPGIWIDDVVVTIEAGAELDLHLYAGLTIKGGVGCSYRIEVSDTVTGPWTPVATVQLTQSPQLWVDTSTPVKTKRFYRAVSL